MRTRVLLAGLVLLLSACASDDDFTPLYGTTISGNNLELSGTYTSNCHLTDSLDYIILTLQINGTKINQSAVVYTDSSCSSALGSDSVVLEASETGTTITTANWVDANGNVVSAPMAGDSSGPLSDNETASVFNVKALTTGLIFTAGQTFQSFIVIDDTGSKTILHFAHSYPATLSAETDPVYTRQ